MSQTVVNGNVVEMLTGKSIPGANVIAKNLNGKLIGFSSSDEKGKFSLKINEPVDSLFINATMLGYKPYTAKQGLTELLSLFLWRKERCSCKRWL